MRVVQQTQLESIHIRKTGNRFMNPIPSNRHESFPLLLIRHAGSLFARDIESIVDLDFEGGLKMLSLRQNRHESYELTEVCGHTLRTRKVHVSLFHGSCLPVGYVGWVENVVNSTRFDQIDSSCRKAICETRLRANRVKT